MTIFEKLRTQNHLTGKGLAETFTKKGYKIDRNKINRLETDQTPDGEALKAYSDHFNVSTDYLLGLTKIPNKSEDLKMISKYTGLDEESLQIVNNMNMQPSPEHERWIETLNTVIHNPNILYYLSELIYPKQIYGIVQPGDNEDEIKEGNLVLKVEGYPQFHPIDEHLIDIDVWERIKKLVNGLKKDRKDSDTYGEESSIPGKRNGQRNKAKRSQA